MALDFVVFSKDRPAQLELLLRSVKRFVSGWGELGLSVVYLATDDHYARGYQLARELHPEPRWVDERETGQTFRDLALEQLGARPYTAFLMDDQVFKAPFSLDAPELALLDDPEVLCVSLRMDPGMDYCYPLDRVTGVPTFESGTVWRWGAVEGDWGYPMSLDAHIFRTEQIAARLRELEFANPNTMEAALAAAPLPAPLAACLPVAPTVNIPENRVQAVCDNRHGDGDPAALNTRFLAGERLSLDSLAGVRTRSPHAELELVWEPGEAEVRVSVVIPCFNYGHHLEEAVASVLAQDMPGVEVLVVDNGSTDDTVEVARRLVAEQPYGRVRLLHQANSGGPAGARNAGIAATSGEYVLCLDADDRLALGFLERCVAALDADPAAGFAYGDQRDFGDREMVHVTPPYDGSRLPIANFLGTATLVRRRAWELAGGYDPGIGYEDWDFWIGCAAAGCHGVKADGAVWEYRVHGDGRWADESGRDREVKAAIVLKRPHLYTQAQVGWARGVLDGVPEALAVPDTVGVVPDLGAEPGPPEADLGTRSFTTIAFAEEVVADPGLVAAYAGRFSADDDATLVIFAPDVDPSELGARLLPALAQVGCDQPGGPDLLGLAVPAATGAPVVADVAHAVLSRQAPDGAFAALERFDGDSVDALRSLAERTWGEDPMQRLYRGFFGPGDVVFDIGANLGNRTETFLALEARVVAVEPQAPLADQLRARWAHEPALTVIEAALAAEEGVGELHVSNAHTLTTMATDWIEDTRRSGRFAEYSWDERRIVPTSTLARLIAEHGEPAFCKIDVEGFELEVLRGLDRPLRALSIEFSSERLPATRACLDRLAELGPVECNYSLGESMELELADWVTPGDLLERLGSVEGDLPWGDVYVRALSGGSDGLEAELRETMGSLPDPADSGGDTPYWLDKRRELRSLVASEDPAGFLGWGPLVETMVVTEAPYVPDELSALQSDPEWEGRWHDAVEEDDAGTPPRLRRYPRSSGNLVTHAYHAWAFERATGLRVEELLDVVEFGGGYGSMARLFLRLGFRGGYHVHDLPELGALQRYFLRTVLAARPELSTPAAGLSFGERLQDVPPAAGEGPRLFVGTWSLSEVPLEVRAAWRPVLDSCSAFLIGYQESFQGIDNRAWFDDFAAARPDVSFTHHEIPHIPGNWYLLGTVR